MSSIEEFLTVSKGQGTNFAFYVSKITKGNDVIYGDSKGVEELVAYLQYNFDL